MIFVTLGTQDKNFTRLLKLLDDEINKGIIKDKVVVQAGYTKYESSNMEIFDYVSNDDFNKYMKESSFVITHAGVGSIFTALKNNKKIMAIARLSKYGEQHNDHQLDILNEFDRDGYLIKFDDVESFEEGYKKLENFTPKKYKSNTKNMINLINDFINKTS